MRNDGGMCAWSVTATWPLRPTGARLAAAAPIKKRASDACHRACLGPARSD